MLRDGRLIDPGTLAELAITEDVLTEGCHSNALDELPCVSSSVLPASFRAGEIFYFGVGVRATGRANFFFYLL